MIIPTLLALAAFGGVVGYLVGTAQGKADVAAVEAKLASLKAQVAIELPKIEAAAKADVAAVDIAVKNAVAKVKALVAKL